MEQRIHILMVDDHPLIIEGYQNILLATKKPHQDISIDVAHNCEDAVDLIKKSFDAGQYDVCFFDISLPPSADGMYNSGEDLAKLARQHLPEARIVILTMFNESLRILNIIKEINPEGLLIKSDLTSRELSEAFQHILDNPPYYSSTVNNFLNSTVTSDIYIDEINRKILHLLSTGVKTKGLKDHISLSLSAIEKRKRHLKLLFSVDDGKDETLINEARKNGFI